MSRCGDSSHYICYIQERDYFGKALETFGLGKFLDKSDYSFLIKDYRTIQNLFSISPGEYVFFNSSYDPNSGYYPSSTEFYSPYLSYKISKHPTLGLFSLEMEDFLSFEKLGPPELLLERYKDTLFKFITIIANPPPKKSFNNKLRKELKHLIDNKIYIKYNILLKLINFSISANLEEWVIEFISEQILWREGYITIREVLFGKKPDLIAIKIKGLKEGFSLHESIFSYFPEIFDFRILENMEIEEVVVMELEPENRIHEGIKQAIEYYHYFRDFVSSSAVITNNPIRLGWSEEVDIWSIPAYEDLENSNIGQFQKSEGAAHQELSEFAKEFWKENLIWNIKKGLEMLLSRYGTGKLNNLNSRNIKTFRN